MPAHAYASFRQVLFGSVWVGGLDRALLQLSQCLYWPVPSLSHNRSAPKDAQALNVDA